MDQYAATGLSLMPSIAGYHHHQLRMTSEALPRGTPGWSASDQSQFVMNGIQAMDGITTGRVSWHIESHEDKEPKVVVAVQTQNRIGP